MRSAAFIFILLVAVVMGVDNDIDDVNNGSDDVHNSTNAGNQVKTTDDIVECSIISEQYDDINNKLTELALKLELLQTAVDKLDSAPSTTVSGISSSSSSSSFYLSVIYDDEVDDMSCLHVVLSLQLATASFNCKFCIVVQSLP